MKIDAVDLFCGAGGLSHGLLKAGVTVRAGIDLDPHCDYPYTQNNGSAKFLLKDVCELDSKTISKLYRPTAFKLLAGCAPCQPFSTLRNGTDRKSSDKWPLLNEFSRLVRECGPDLVTMENVPNLLKQSIFTDFVKALKHQGYHVSSKIVDAAHYGVPQRRKRLVLLASLHGPIRLLSPEEIGVEQKTVREAIGNLPKVAAGATCPSDSLHKARTLNPLNMKRMRASKPGGTWEDWPDELRLDCHKKDGGSTFRSVYGRLEWDKPSGTITTQSNNFGTGRFGHPEQDRALTIREMAVLQSFPEDYQFVPAGQVPEFTSVCRLIGNAVPVELGYAVGLSVKTHLQGLMTDD